MDAGVDETVDGRWMTHAELAQARDISTASAIKLALRHRWRKQKDNRGTLRCLVPTEFASPQRDTGAVTAAEGGAEASTAIAALEAAVRLLGDQLSHERTRADTVREAHAGEVAALLGRVNVADSFAAELRSRLDDLQGKLTDAQGELAAAMDRADQSAAELQAVQIGLGEAQADVAELRQSEEARKGRGLVARLRGALRGE